MNTVLSDHPHARLTGSWRTLEPHLMIKNGHFKTFSDVDLLLLTAKNEARDGLLREGVRDCFSHYNFVPQKVAIRYYREYRNMPHCAELMRIHTPNLGFVRDYFLLFWTYIQLFEHHVLAKSYSTDKESVYLYSFTKFAFSFLRNVLILKCYVPRSYRELVAVWKKYVRCPSITLLLHTKLGLPCLMSQATISLLSSRRNILRILQGIDLKDETINQIYLAFSEFAGCHVACTNATDTLLHASKYIHANELESIIEYERSKLRGLLE